MLSIGGRSCEGDPSSGNERPLKLMGNRCAERAARAQLVGVWCLSGSLLGWQPRGTGPRGSGTS